MSLRDPRVEQLEEDDLARAERDARAAYADADARLARAKAERWSAQVEEQAARDAAESARNRQERDDLESDETIAADQARSMGQSPKPETYYAPRPGQRSRRVAS